MTTEPTPPILIEIVGGGGIDAGLVAIAASILSLVLGLAGIWSTLHMAKQTAAREQSQRRAEAYLGLLKIVERYGLAVQDQIYNLTLPEVEPGITAPFRTVEKVPRSARAEALAYAAAYGTDEVKRCLSEWLSALEAWEAKYDEFALENQITGADVFSQEQAAPERDAESTARAVLVDAASKALRV